MVPSSTLTSKGQITIPVEIRKRLGLHEGDKVEFVMEGNFTAIRPARRSDNPFAPFRGALAHKLPKTIDETVTEERAERGREPASTRRKG